MRLSSYTPHIHIFLVLAQIMTFSIHLIFCANYADINSVETEAIGDDHSMPLNSIEDQINESKRKDSHQEHNGNDIKSIEDKLSHEVPNYSSERGRSKSWEIPSIGNLFDEDNINDQHPETTKNHDENNSITSAEDILEENNENGGEKLAPSNEEGSGPAESTEVDKIDEKEAPTNSDKYNHRENWPEFLRKAELIEAIKFLAIENNYRLTKSRIARAKLRWVSAQPTEVKKSYKTYTRKIGVEKKKFARKRRVQLEKLSKKAREADSKIQAVIKNVGISLSQEIMEINQILRSYPENVGNELKNLQIIAPLTGNMPLNSNTR